MGALTLLVLVIGGFVAGLVTVAMVVAGWELLREREQLDELRRDRAVFAATSPLPLAQPGSAGSTVPLARPLGAAPAETLTAAATRRDPNWTETRPMVLCTPALDDETRTRRESDRTTREPDLLLE